MEIILDMNISNQKIELSKGHYKIDIVGGWGVKLNSFKLFFENINDETRLKPEKASWPIQSYFRGRRARRIYKFEVKKYGVFKVNYENIDTLKLKEINLLLFDMLYKIKEIEKINFIIYK